MATAKHEITKLLRQNGYHLSTQAGKHEVWRGPEGQLIRVPHSGMSYMLERTIHKQIRKAGVTP